MKKRLTPLLILLLVSTNAFADRILGFWVGGYAWHSGASGGITADKLSTIYTNYELAIDESSVEGDTNTVYFVALEHLLPYVPNIKLTQTFIEHSGSGIESKSNISNFPWQDIPVLGTVNLDNTDLTLYYQILDNMISLDLGIAARDFDGELSIQPKAGTGPFDSTLLINGAAPIEATLGLLYGSTRLDLPGSDFSIGAEIYAGDNNKEKALDFNAYTQYETAIGIGFTLGYRSLDTEIKTKASTGDKLVADFDVKGPYLSLYYHL